MLVASFLLALIFGYEECAFPNERCLCNGDFSLCKCSQITSVSTLNLTNNYYSHLVEVSGMGCLPCSSACLKCTSLAVCEICRQEYELISGDCFPCPINCESCSSGICTKCMAGFYIDSRRECQVCPLPGTL